MQSTCNPELIEQFLDGRLSAGEQAAFEDHLDTCDACCDELRELTVGHDWWDEARCFLSSVDDTPEERGETISLDFLNPTDDPRMLGRFAGYEIAGVIGQGGMAIVLKALDPALNRYAAIKVLAPHFASSAAARQRFAREAQAAAAVLHDNVIAIHGVGKANNLPYLIMPYVRGESLQKRIDRVGALTLEEILRIAMQTARGLAAAHDQGLVHRDIKPANILLPDGVERIMLTDFGLARAADDASLTRSGVIAGTPQYMSPEQAQGDAIDMRSDLFSLGSVMYAMCTGRLPFRAPTPFGVLRRITDQEPRDIRDINSAIPDWLCRIVTRLHSKCREGRYASASEVAELLRQCLAHVQTSEANLPIELQGGERNEAGSRNLRMWVAATVAVSVSVFFWFFLPHRFNAANGTKPARALGVSRAAIAEPSSGAVTVPVSPWDVENEVNQIESDIQSIQTAFDSVLWPFSAAELRVTEPEQKVVVAGERITVQFRVRNIGERAAPLATLTARIPNGTHVDGTVPGAEVVDDALVFSISELGSGDEVLLRMSLVADRDTSIRCAPVLNLNPG